MKRPVSYAADVRRRIIEVLITIAPDCPLPIRLLQDVIRDDSMLGGPYDRVLDNVAGADSAIAAGIRRLGTVEGLSHDPARGTVAITAAGQAILRARFQQLAPTPQAR